MPEMMVIESQCILLEVDSLNGSSPKHDLIERFWLLGLKLAATMRTEWGEELVVIATKPLNFE